MNLEETIFFYTRNNYLIINNLLLGNMNQLWEVAEIVNNDSKGMLKEHEDGIRILDKKSIEKYQNRVYQKINEIEKAKVINIAKSDISNILCAMKPTENEIVVYRTVWHIRFGDSIPHYNVDDIVEFKIFLQHLSLYIEKI